MRRFATPPFALFQQFESAQATEPIFRNRSGKSDLHLFAQSYLDAVRKQRAEENRRTFRPPPLRLL